MRVMKSPAGSQCSCVVEPGFRAAWPTFKTHALFPLPDSWPHFRVHLLWKAPTPPQSWGSQRGWRWWKKPHWSPGGPSQEHLGEYVSPGPVVGHKGKDLGQERSELNSDIKKEVVRTGSLWACILNVFSLCKKKNAKVMFLHKGSLCFIAILIYGPYIPVIVLNWIAK